MKTVIQIQANLAWRVESGSQVGSLVAFCDPLGICTEADSVEELHSMIPEAIHLLLVDLVRENEFDAFLSERGWTANHLPAPQDAGADPEFDIPWHLEGLNDPPRLLSECH